MAIPRYQKSSGAIIFENTPDEIEMIKLKKKVTQLEGKVTKLESLVEELIKAMSPK